MTARTLTIPTFIDPAAQDIDPVVVRIDLVDVNNERITGLLDPSGVPIADSVEISVSTSDVDVSIWPNEEIEGIPAYGSDADATNYYLVTLKRQSTKFYQQIRTQVESGGALDWSTFITGAGAIAPGQVNLFLKLLERDTDPDDPPEGQTVIWMSDGTESGDDGDVLVKITAAGVTKTLTLVDFSVLS